MSGCVWLRANECAIASCVGSGLADCGLAVALRTKGCFRVLLSGGICEHAMTALFRAE